jgi:hypothetical protein
MEIDVIKVEIEKQYQHWKLVHGDIADFTTAEIFESAVRSIIINYCEGKGYEVEGLPFQKRILGKTDMLNIWMLLPLQKRMFCSFYIFTIVLFAKTAK